MICWRFQIEGKPMHFMTKTSPVNSMGMAMSLTWRRRLQGGCGTLGPAGVFPPGFAGFALAPSRSTKLGSAQGHKPSPSLRFMMFYYWVYPYSMVNPIITYPSLISDVKWRPTGWLIGWFMALGLPQILRVFVLQVSSPEICSVDHCEPRWTKLLLSTDDPPCAKNGNQKGLHFRGWNMASVANHCGWKKSCTSLGWFKTLQIMG